MRKKGWYLKNFTPFHSGRPGEVQEAAHASVEVADDPPPDVRRGAHRSRQIARLGPEDETVLPIQQLEPLNQGHQDFRGRYRPDRNAGKLERDRPILMGRGLNSGGREALMPTETIALLSLSSLR